MAGVSPFKPSAKCHCEHFYASHVQGDGPDGHPCNKCGCPTFVDILKPASKWHAAMKGNGAAKPAAPTKPAAIPACILCKTPGHSQVRVDGYCESCYTHQFIEPIHKELINAYEVVKQLEHAKSEHQQKLILARQAQMGRVRQIWACKNDCGFSSEQYIQIIWHEEKCTVAKAVKIKSIRAARKPVEPQDEEVGI